LAFRHLSRPFDLAATLKSVGKVLSNSRGAHLVYLTSIAEVLVVRKVDTQLARLDAENLATLNADGTNEIEQKRTL